MSFWYLTVCKGWGELLAHATAWMLFIPISTLSLERLDCFYFPFGEWRGKFPHHPLSAKPSAEPVCFPSYESVALSASLNRSHTLTAAFDQAPRATAWSSKSEAYSEETADWDNWDSLVWGQQEWWESNREHWLHHIIVIMLPTEATEPSPVFAIGTDGLCAEAFILHVGSTYCFLDEAK